VSTPTTTPSARDDRIDGIRIVLALAAVLWGVEVVDALDHHHLDQYGIQPRHVDGLVGIIAAPFLHGSWGHLIGNTIPFVAMGLGIALSGAARVLAVTLIVMGVGGLGTWLIGPDYSVHIGASGVVFGYASYLISRGIFNRSLLELAMGAVVVAIWGGALLSSLAPRDGISWQGHVFGAVGGLVAARVLMRGREGGAGERATASRNA
jgi:membrane associated rhomboid family serine protease